MAALAAVMVCHSQGHAANAAHAKQLLDTGNCPRCALAEIAVVQGKPLRKANLQGADLRDADLRGVDLSGADLSGARLSGARLEGAKLVGANLTGAGLHHASLNGANLTTAILRRAEIKRTHLQNATMYGAQLENAIFDAASLPDIRGLADASGIESLKYEQYPTSLLLLRKAFQEAGLQQKQKEVTYAIMRQRRSELTSVENAGAYLMFELTSAWGLAPFRPLIIMLILLIPFGLIYTAAISWPRSAAIWRIWEKDRVVRSAAEAGPLRLSKDNCIPLLNGMFFSLLSAFYVGWRELNVGTWIGRLNPQEYTLQATGWLRTVAGIQSLISIFLLALAFLTYFGEPFG